MTADNTDFVANADATPELLVSFAIPCYNMVDYLDRCVQSILTGSRHHLSRIEILLVDDGSTDNATPAAIDSWQERYPDVIRAIHQVNGGHGMAVNTGLANARARYFKVVDADDWLDRAALVALLECLESLEERVETPDLVITNYVYEHLEDDVQRRIDFANVFPTGRCFGWEDVGRFLPHQNLLMHTALYRTALLKEIGIELPAHTFYVDNIYVFKPLPAVKVLYYLDVDLYRYYIGREGQSVAEATMIKRIDQQLLITRIMIDAYQLQAIYPRRLREYMTHYLLMMMTISTVFLRLSGVPDEVAERRRLWDYLRHSDPDTYRRIRGSALGLSVNMPGFIGKHVALTGYRLSQKIFKFN
jgi:glycosyltransferase involved in cell wall biosynthesis